MHDNVRSTSMHALLTAFVASAIVAAQPDQPSIATRGARWGHAMAFDAARLVLFGGLYLGGLYGDTWEWRGRHWVRNGPVFAPTLDHHGLVYDAARAALLAFGGKD